ncbi:MAG: fructose-bisphosphatase class II [Chloroflexi bacterium]|nr:fructose-bisphosphatase class II [Chloroflexota bacterium]
MYAHRNIGLDLVRVTETAALAAGHWLGSGDRDSAHRAGHQGHVQRSGYIGYGWRGGHWRRTAVKRPFSTLRRSKVGTGHGPEVDLVVDPIDGTNLLIRGQPGAISVVGVTPRGTMWSPARRNTWKKSSWVRKRPMPWFLECLDAPAAWTLALVARVKRKAVRDLTIIVLDRTRNTS